MRNVTARPTALVIDDKEWYALKVRSDDPKNKITYGGQACDLRFSSALSNQKFPFADPAALNPMTTPPLPEQIELHRDRLWPREEDLRVKSAVGAEHFIEDVGFANTRTDARRAGPSLYMWHVREAN